MSTKSYQNLEQSLFQLQQENKALRELLEQQDVEMAEALSEAVSASRAKSDFLAMMSHEIRTPMNAILGYTKILMGSDLLPAHQRYVERVHTSCDGLLQIINDILDFSKIEAGKLALENTPFSLASVFERVSSVFSQQARQKGIQLHCGLDADIPECLLGDPLRIGQIVSNLVSNALKFTKQGSITLSGRVCEQKEDTCWIEIQCRDTGIGISRESQEKLFSPFTQADNSTTRQYGGTGLGLSICRRLANMMNGDIIVTSELGCGSTFVVNLMLKFADAAVAIDGLVPKESETDSEGLAGKRILLVEDNEMNQELVCEMLSDTGLVIDIAGNGLEALEKIKTQSYELVLMDVQMPLIDGLETTRRLRLVKAFQNLPVVALTANASPEDRKSCLAAGMNDFLSKPISPYPLLQALNRWLLPESEKTVSQSEINDDEPENSPINTVVALQMMGGKNALLRKMLGIFSEQYADSPKKIKTLVNQKNWSELTLVVHTIKGLSANIAANSVRQCCEKIESYLKQNADQPDGMLLDELVLGYEIEMKKTIRAISELLASPKL